MDLAGFAEELFNSKYITRMQLGHIFSDVSEQLTDVTFPVDAISKKVHKLKTGSAFGPDRIGPRVLQETSDILCGPLSVVFMLSLEEGVVPDNWKRGNITPIFKSGSKMTPGNYRPVSLTCIVCKLMESIIRDNIISHLNKYALIHSSQHGFTAGKSCQTNLIEYLNTLTTLVDEGHNIDVVYLDFAKAFDKVPHQRLLLKVEGLGISGKVLAWIESWLTDRQQRVVLNGKASEWLPVTSGVPQGSVLGPTLFVIFINDLDGVVDLVDGFISKFADDTKYGRVVRSEEDCAKMQSDINKLLEWADTWQMEFNTKKCKIMHFGRTNPHHCYCMGGYAPAGTVLEEVSDEKDIGVIVSDTLKPSNQCARAAKRANSILGQMRRAFHYRDKVVWVRLYKTYVKSTFGVCCSVLVTMVHERYQFVGTSTETCCGHGDRTESKDIRGEIEGVGTHNTTGTTKARGSHPSMEVSPWRLELDSLGTRTAC